MPFQLVIPDDYQHASHACSGLFRHPGIQTTVLGDLQLDPVAPAALAKADGLLLIRERTQIDAAFLANDNPWQGPAGKYAALFTRIVNTAPAPVGLGGG